MQRQTLRLAPRANLVVKSEQARECVFLRGRVDRDVNWIALRFNCLAIVLINVNKKLVYMSKGIGFA